MVGAWSARAAGHGREDGDDVSVGERGLHAAEEADVLVVEIDVDEPVERAVPTDRRVAQAAVPAVEVAEEVAQRLALAVDGLAPAGVATEDRRDADFDGHGHILANVI